MIDKLIKDYPEERAFIFEKASQYARDIGDITRQRTREASRDQSNDPLLDLSGNTAVIPAQTSNLFLDETSLLDWPPSAQTCSDNSFDEILRDLGKNFGIFAGAEHDSDFLDSTSTLSHSRDRLRSEQIEFRDAIMSPFCEYDSLATATDSVRTDFPASLRSNSIEEFGSDITAHKTGGYPSPHETTETDPKNGRKTSERTKKTRPYSSIESQGLLHSKRRRITPSTSSDVGIRDAFVKKLRKKDHGLINDLTNLCLATASLDSFCQLKDVLAATRGINSSTLATGSSNMAETLRMLDKLEESQQLSLFLRRIYLLKLWRLRKVTSARLENDRERRPEEGQPTVPPVGKVESNVLDHLMKEAYPHIDRRPEDAGKIRDWRKQYESKRKSLQNRFQAAKRWNSLTETFSPGILALIPSGGQYCIQNQKYVIHICTFYLRC